MKYYKYDKAAMGVGHGITYLETEQGGHLRQITVDTIVYQASNVVRHGRMSLPDGAIDYDALALSGEVTPIPEQEFEAIWNAHLAIRQGEWNKVKRRYPLGTPVQGYIEIFYPQGVIVNLGGNALGVADYEACRASTEPQFMYTRYWVTARVKGYDEQNQWIRLESPQVHPERVP